jgi:hypothetical protein
VISQNFWIVAALLPLAGFGSYIRDTLRGAVQPNRVSWALWATAPMIAFAAELAAGTSLRVAAVTFSLGAGPLLVLAATFAGRPPDPSHLATAQPAAVSIARRRGHQQHWQLTRLDYACGALSVLALAGWAITGQGNVAIALAIAADLLAAAPTIAKSWTHPESESAATYAASGAAAAITLLIITNWRLASYGFPLYVLTVCTVITTLIMLPHWAAGRLTS